MQKLYDLRCCFDYPLKNSWKSMWNRSGKLPTDQAWFNAGGIIRAYIEAKHINDRTIIPMAEVSKDNFMNFEWVFVQKFGFGKTVGNIGDPSCIGLSIVTPDVRITAYIDGTLKIVQREDKEIKHKLWSV